MKCYLINLDRAPERLARMADLLHTRGIDFERVPAVDGKAFTTEQVTEYRKQRGNLATMSLGDIACGASHLRVLKMVAESSDDYGVVMEDDLHLASDIADYLMSSEWIPADADIVKLETFWQVTLIDRDAKALKNNRKLSKLHGTHGGTALYIISRSFAQELLSEFKAGMDYVDGYMFGKLIKRNNVYQVWPAPAVQDTVGGFHSTAFLSSEINSQRPFNSRPKPRGLRKIWREIKRGYAMGSNLVQKIHVKLTSNLIRGRISYKP